MAGGGSSETVDLGGEDAGAVEDEGIVATDLLGRAGIRGLLPSRINIAR